MTIDPSVFVQMGFREYSYAAKFSPEINFA
jgi:hypothetical protein